MDAPKNCTECANVSRCEGYIKEGIIVYYGCTLCKPILKQS